jgi:hypothetical protein
MIASQTEYRANKKETAHAGALAVHNTMAQAPAQEFELAAPPTDGITNVAFCSGTPLLLVSSWDQA